MPWGAGEREVAARGQEDRDGEPQKWSSQEGVGAPSDLWGGVGIESAHGLCRKERKTAQYFFYLR